MTNEPEILKLRVVLCFLQAGEEGCSVTGISRTLGEEKYKISRAINALAKDGVIDKTDIRHPILTKYGEELAKKYSERMDITINHLLYEGVDAQNANQDAYYWALFNSDKTMEVIRSSGEKYRVKYEMRNESSFRGDTLCKRMKDGIYQLPFLIYREKFHNGSNISMANGGFEHPCTLSIENGVGTVKVHAVEIMVKSPVSGLKMRGKVKHLKYYDGYEYVNAESNGDVLSFPAEALNFVNIGSGMGQILHGSVCLKMSCSAGLVHMPESVAIFTLLI